MMLFLTMLAPSQRWQPKMTNFRGGDNRTIIQPGLGLGKALFVAPRAPAASTSRKSRFHASARSDSGWRPEVRRVG